MAAENKAYIDSSAFISFLDRSDKYHLQFVRYFSDPPKLVTTPLVISETHAWFLKRYDREKALRFLVFIDELSVLKTLTIGADAISDAKQLLKRFSDQDLTLVDATGLMIMKQEKIKLCWSTDRHLGITGVRLVVHE
jgi:predicted nucleic acid-binding protein